MGNAWRRETTPKILSPKSLLLLLSLSFLLLLFFFFTSNPTKTLLNSQTTPPKFTPNSKIPPFDCSKSPQSHPIIANIVEGLKYPYIFAISDLGTIEKPHIDIKRILKNKPFKKPDISGTVQDVLGKFQAEGKKGIFIDVGANVGMATFAAAVMGFHVLAFEPVFENLQRICDGIHFNRVADFVTVFEAAASDHMGNITFHKLVGRLDNSAVSATGAKLAFKSNQEIAVQVKTIPLDDVIPESEPVLLVKIDVQGWEHHVLKGAKKLLSRKGPKAPYLIYEEDDLLLEASNSTAKEIRDFLMSFGYEHCTHHDGDAHCTKY